MSDEKRATARRFGAAADAYFASVVHREGADRQTLAAWCREADRALDIATGAGHTAGALLDADVDAVVAVDTAPEMVATTVTAYGPTGVVADAERLPFVDDSFEAVTCRIAAHHFPDPQAFVAETARVLASGGVLAFEDNVAPPDPDPAAWLNDVERLRDPSHVALHTEAQWVDWLESAGFVVEETAGTATALDFADWMDRTNVPETDRAELHARFRDAPRTAHDRFDVSFDDAGRVTAWANPKTLIRARRP